MTHGHLGRVNKNGDKWIGVDFDGTLAHNGEPGDETPFDPKRFGLPIMEMVTRVQWMILDGWKVRILTARLEHGLIRQWCIRHIGVALEVTNMKDGDMLALFDDRAIRVERNTGRVCECFPVAKDARKRKGGT